MVVDKDYPPLGGRFYRMKLDYVPSNSQTVFYCDDTFQVSVSLWNEDGVEHLNIKRLDGTPCHDWREFQAIKSLICGPEREGVEIYPAESRLIDIQNCYHLFVYPEGYKMPLSFGAHRAVIKERTKEERHERWKTGPLEIHSD